MPVNNVCPFCFSNSFHIQCTACGYTYKENYPDCLPQFYKLADRYIIGCVIGAGGFGITYSAWDEQFKKRIAIKEYFPRGMASRIPGSEEISILSSTNDYSLELFQHGLDRFLDEAKALYALQDCDGTVSVENYILENNTAYIVMDFVVGRNLSQEAKAWGGRIPYRRAMLAMISVAEALHYVHQHGILHRDISPDNILISAEGKTTIIDFGAAREYINNKNLTVFLKKAYAPPEQYISDGNQGQWTDVYSLASSFYYLLSGSRAPDAMSRMDGALLDRLYGVVNGLPEEMDDVFRTAMCLDVSERYQTMEQLISDIYDVDPSLKRSSDNIKQFFGPRQPPSNNSQAKLYIVNGPASGTSFILEPHKVYSVGRQPFDNPLFLYGSDEISRNHFSICFDAENEHFIISDTNSKNGTFFTNGFKLIPNQKYILMPGSQFYLSSVHYLLEVGV